MAVIRTVVAVTAPVVLCGPKAATQSPIASTPAVVGWTCVMVVDFGTVTLSFSVFKVGLFGALVFFLLAEVVPDGRVKPLRTTPVTETVVPLTDVTLPLALVKPAPPKRPAAPRNVPPPPPKVRAPPVPPGGKPAPPDPPVNVRVPAPKALPLGPWLHEPPDAGELTVTARAAIVVLDIFEIVPRTLTHSPAEIEVDVNVTVRENCVVPVQFTVV